VDDVFLFTDMGGESSDWSGIMLADDHSPETKLIRDLFWEALYAALEELPEEQRSAFIRHEMEGISFKETAAQTGEPVATLISRKRYAILHLRERLSEFKQELLNN
jgi:DNA-directed RNA polymerase specialized sigma24 family protein